MTVSDAAVRAGFDALPGQAAILDGNGRILETNRAWREFGAANDGGGDHVGVNYLNVCDASDDAKAVRTGEAIRRLLGGEQEMVAVEYPCHGPERERWFTMRGMRFDHDDQQFALVMHVDITERKRAELEIREQNDRLETVASVLSHDLRNPLNVAIGRAEMVESEHADPLVRSLERMEAIVSDALLLATQEEVRETRQVELTARAERAWGQVETDDTDLAVGDSATFEADPDLLGHVFENLFRNADEHGATTVRVGALDAGFYVEDDGPGIPPEDREAVFDSSYSTAESGTGLGLAIVEQIVDAHGWSIRVTESGGATDAGSSRTVKPDGGEVELTPNQAPTSGARFEIRF